MYCSAAVAAAVGQNLTRAHLWAFVFARLSEGEKQKYKKYEEGAGGEEQLGVAVVHMDFSPFFVLSTLSLSSSSLSFLVLLRLSLLRSGVPGTGRTCCSSTALWLIRLHGCSPAAV